MSDLVTIRIHLIDGNTHDVQEPVSLGDVDALRAMLDKRLDADRLGPGDPVLSEADEGYVQPPPDRTFRVGTDEAGSLIPVQSIVRITWEAVPDA